MGGEEGDMNRARRYRVILPLAVALGLVAFACWPRGPRLEWYTTPPKVMRGQTVRLQVLVPAGWRIVPRYQPPESLLDVTLTPPPRFAALPSRLRKWIDSVWPERAPHRGGLLIWLEADKLSRPLRQWQPRLKVDPPERHSDQTMYVVNCGATGGGAGDLEYWSTHRGFFEATYRQICQSFRVVR